MRSSPHSVSGGGGDAEKATAGLSACPPSPPRHGRAARVPAGWFSDSRGSSSNGQGENASPPRPGSGEGGGGVCRGTPGAHHGL